jgi:tetratricopeptide (TPR) repeat protein
MNQIKNYLSRDKLKQEIEQLTYNPDNFDSLHSLAEKYLRNKDYESALSILDKIVDNFDGTSQLYVNRAICLIRLDRLDEAVESLEQSLELDETNQDGLKLKLMLEEKLQKLAKYTLDPYS